MLKKDNINGVIKKFSINEKLRYTKPIKYEPDCFVYLLVGREGDKYALICRDYVQDDLEAENRVLKEELNIEIVNRFRPTGQYNPVSGGYGLRIPDYDSFDYIFSLIKFR